MNIVLLGGPGSGKGTQAVRLSKELKLVHMSTGDMLREAVKANSGLGIKAKNFMEKGQLVPDDLVINLIFERVNRPDALTGFILDGFPRNLAQAKSLDEILKTKNVGIDRAINLSASEKTIVQRLSGRRVCTKCGANFHIVNMPPKIDSICDNCGEKLYQRKDDNEETIKQRLAVYLKENAALLDYYKKQNKLIEVDANFPAEVVNQQIIDLIRNDTNKKQRGVRGPA